MQKNDSFKTILLIAFVLQIVWGLVPSASKLVIDEIPVELYISLRWTISGLIFISFVWITRSWQPIPLKDFSVIALLGLGGYGFASLGTLYGLKTGGVANFALMSALGPVVISAMSILFLKERPQQSFYLALPVCVIGLILLVVGKYQVSSFEIAGLSAVFILTGYTLEAIVFVNSKRFKSKVSTAQYLAISQLSAACAFWLMQALFFHQSDQIGQLTVKGIGAALFVSIVACVLCYAILYWLLGKIDGHRLALFDGIHALSATLFGYLLFQETITPMMWMGGALLLSGLVVGNLKGQ